MSVAKCPRPIKWYGGKHYLASRIVEMMPPHTQYVEPFFGGGAVLLAKPFEGVAEVANDIDGELSNFWFVLQNVDTFHDFKRIVEAVPFSETEWWNAHAANTPDSIVDRAVNFFIQCRQSMMGKRDSFTALTRTRTRGGM